MNDKLLDVKSWYEQLIFDLKLLNFEGIVKTKHAIGKRIIEDELKFEKAKYGEKTIENLAKDLDIHASDLWACMKFAKKYPELSHDVRELSWHRIRNYLLPEKPHVSQATGENEWYTPPDIIEAARRTMGGIDCDPATSEKANESIKAEIVFTIKENGLNQKWNGNVWMNPPYSQPLISNFSEAISSKFESGEINQACILVNNATETAWFQRMARLSSAICFISGRIKFIDMDGNSSGAPLQGQAILYMGMNVSMFTKNFLEKGLIFYAKREDSK